MPEALQWVVNSVILIGAIVMLAWRFGWLAGTHGSKACSPSGACPKCEVADAIAQRVKDAT